MVEGLFDSIGRKKALNNNVNNNINNNILANDIHVEGLNDFKGLHHMVIDTINEADIDARKDFLNNVLLVGGNTLIPGFDEFFTRKLLDIAPPVLYIYIYIILFITIFIYYILFIIYICLECKSQINNSPYFSRKTICSLDWW